MQVQLLRGLNQVTSCSYTALCRATQVDITYLLQKPSLTPCRDLAQIWITTPFGTHAPFPPMLPVLPQV